MSGGCVMVESRGGISDMHTRGSDDQVESRVSVSEEK